MLEHGDVAWAARTGWPLGAKEENGDGPEARREFAGEHFSDFLAFAQAGQPGLLEEFIDHYGWQYRAWLN